MRLLPSWCSFIRTSSVSRTCAPLPTAAGPNTRGASQPGNYHQEDKIQGRRVWDRLVAYRNRSPGEGASFPTSLSGKSHGVPAPLPSGPGGCHGYTGCPSCSRRFRETEGMQGHQTCSSHHFSRVFPPKWAGSRYQPDPGFLQAI